MDEGHSDCGERGDTTATSMARSPSLRRPRMVLAVPVAVLAVTAFAAIGPALDDAYIVYRYVDRFLAGHGFTFNNHERVEGYTSLTWTVLLSFTTWVTGLRPHVASVWLNYGLILLTAVAMRRLAAILHLPRSATFAALVLLAVSFLYFRTVYIGLEFGLYALLLLVFFCAVFAGLQAAHVASRIYLAAAGVLAGLLFGTRPESLMLLPVTALLIRMFHRTSRMGLVALILPWLFTAGAIVCWRLVYYGEWLPNSVIAKALSLRAMPSLPRLLRVWGDGAHYLLRAYVQNPALALAAAVLVTRALRRPASQFEALLLFAPILIAHLAVVMNGGDWMPYSRFVSVFAPLYLVLFCACIKDWLSRPTRAGVVCFAVFALLHVAASLPFAQARPTLRVDAFGGWMDLYQEVGRALDPVWVSGDIMMAESIGMLGYAAPRIYIHDPLGLTDRHLAHDPRAQRNIYGRKNWEYSLRLAPAVILLHHWPHQRQWSTYTEAWPTDYAFYYLPWRGNAPKRCLYVAVRRDRANALGEALASLDLVPVTYENVRFPCPSAKADDGAEIPRVRSSPTARANP